MKNFILDSSALLAAAYDEPGADPVRSLLSRSVLSSVNLAECVARGVLDGAPPNEASARIVDMVADIVPFDRELADIAGGLIAQTKAFGLSLGDRACLATAMHYNLEVITADKIWGKLKLDVKIRLIR